MSVTVRGLRAGDEKALHDILLEADFPDQARNILLGRQTFYEVFVAVDEHGVVVGYLDGHLCSDYAERIAQYVRPPQAWGSILAVAGSSRRTGVGRVLLAAFARAARDAGSSYFVCKVDESNDSADRMAFFAACGLRPVMPEQDDDVVAGPLEDVIRLCEAAEQQG